MGHPSQQFYDDAGGELGIGHHAERVTEAEPIRNVLLSDTEWLDRNNERLEREALGRGEKLPPKVVEDPNSPVRGLVDRDVDEQLAAELERIKTDQRTKKMPYDEQHQLAIKIVGERQKARHRNEGAYDENRNEERRVAEEQPDLPLIDRLRIAHARVQARLEANPVEHMDGTQHAPKDAAKEYMGASTSSLMKAPSSGHGGGGSKSRRREKKKGSWICDLCNLEYCEHRPVGGRPSFGGRSSRVDAWVSEEVEMRLRESDVSAGKIVEIVVKAAADGSGIRDILEGLAS